MITLLWWVCMAAIGAAVGLAIAGLHGPAVALVLVACGLCAIAFAGEARR